MTGDPDACRALAAYLTAAEAHEIADRLVGGQPLSMALSGLSAARRAHVRGLLATAGLGAATVGPMIAVLRAIEGALDTSAGIGTVWTAPGNLVQSGQLTSSIHHFVDAARESVICSTFNFQRSSALWTALKGAAARPEIGVRVYMDTEAADKNPARWRPTTTQVADALAGATVLRTRRRGTNMVRNHAKFVSVDHQFLIVTSANFSKSAEQDNIELGLVIKDRLMAQAVEQQMTRFEPHTYEVVGRRATV